jgi:hypothetical protein
MQLDFAKVTIYICIVMLYMWQHFFVRHMLDMMHCEKNLCDMLKVIFGEKYTLKIHGRNWDSASTLVIASSQWLIHKISNPLCHDITKKINYVPYYQIV